MKPIKFKECNTTFGASQPEYLPLPGFVDAKGEVITCWKLSLFERIKILFTGKLWASQLTFNTGLSPMFYTVNKSDILETDAQNTK